MSAPQISRRTAIKWAAGGLAAGTGVGIAQSGLCLTRRTLRLPNWRHADGLRVAQISDVHVNNTGLLRVAREAMEMAVAERPDLFLFTGDFVNESYPDRLAHIRPAFAPLEDLRCPRLACLGNHDYASGHRPRLLAAIAQTPLRLLVNEEFRFGDVRVVGLDDALYGHPDFSLVSRSPEFSTLVMLHEPDPVTQVPQNAALVFSGHSHGGEICLPGGIPIHTPRGSKEYTRGYYPNATVPLYVNRGTATLGPFRTYCPPEVAIFTLRTG